ncbi:MAG: hypothetical protein ACI85N_000086 [Gammaproteobacteria bacterium]|jgi:hypothetical protein
MNNEITDKTKNIIYCLSYGGLLPFVTTLVGIYSSSKELSSYSMIAFVSYGAVILGFVGAVHWGFLLKTDSMQRQGLLLSISVLPGLIGWLALISDLPVALLMFFIAYPLLFVYEKFSELNSLLPVWYMQMRFRLTIVVTIFMFIGLCAVYSIG